MEYEDGEVTIDLEARKPMFEELTDILPENAVHRELEQALLEQLTSMYDQREQLKRQVENQRQRQGLDPQLPNPEQE